jgi:hypothetical protein
VRRHARRRRGGRTGVAAGSGAHIFFFGGGTGLFFVTGAFDVPTCASADSDTAVDHAGPQLPHAGVHHQ